MCGDEVEDVRVGGAAHEALPDDEREHHEEARQERPVRVREDHCPVDRLRAEPQDISKIEYVSTSSREKFTNMRKTKILVTNLGI